jgi:hypothetical protein
LDLDLNLFLDFWTQFYLENNKYTWKITSVKS